MRAWLASVAISLVAVTSEAGPLVSATLRLEFAGIPITVNAAGATGSLIGSRFTLDAGSAFAGSHCASASASCGGIALPVPFTRAVFEAGANGLLSGSLGALTFSPQTGIRGRFFAKAKIGKSPPFTLIQIGRISGTTPDWVRLGEDIHCGFFTSYFSGCGSPAAYGTTQIENDRWHLGPITQTGLTVGSQARADVMATGSVTQTAAGGTRLNLVSLSRVTVRDHSGLTGNFRQPFSARLTLVFAPEPKVAALLASAGVAALLSWRSRRRG